MAGCGKTVLSSTIVEHLKSHCSNSPDLAVDPGKQEATYFLSSFSHKSLPSYPTSRRNCRSSTTAAIRANTKRRREI
ncbi:hypothetical protein BDD12DRAFT_853569 [Trichophaea hybrida]|nr:hypothetical protein BDD12DRAFT_853569 [Trichophaea hybrida]